MVSDNEAVLYDTIALFVYVKSNNRTRRHFEYKIKMLKGNLHLRAIYSSNDHHYYSLLILILRRKLKT